MVETLVAAANDVDVVFEQHVGVALVKAIVLTYECRASLGSMLLNFQIDLSEEIDGVGLGVLVFRIARRFSLGKYQLEMEIVLVVVIRLSGSIESEHAEVVRRSESPRKHFRVHTTGRLDHFSEERDLTLVDVLVVVVPNNGTRGALALSCSWRRCNLVLFAAFRAEVSYCACRSRHAHNI